MPSSVRVHNEYAVLDRRLDTPYSMEVYTPYRVIDQNSKSVRYGVSKGFDTAYWSFLEHGYAVSSLMDTDIDVIDEILEEDFDALLDEGSEIFHSIKGTILEEKLFTELDEFMAMSI
ncbi:hypothetical protein Tco_1219123 [Tanacetum coccineum]